MRLIQNQVIDSGSGITLHNPEQNLDPYHKSREENFAKVTDCRIGGFIGDTTDGLQLNGNLNGIINNVIVSNESNLPDAGDECASIVNGADFVFTNCLFANNGKGVLQGSGDSNLLDIAKGTRSVFYNCVFINNSRRNPFIQSGQSLIANCLVANWGLYFHQKSFGIRAGSHAQVTVINTLFYQHTLWQCLQRGHTIQDTFGHYFWPFWIGPGFRRAAYADYGGHISCYNCYKNHSWLYIQNHHGSYMPEDEACSLLKKLQRIFPTLDSLLRQ